jgi:hypothetical protein
LVIGKKLSMTIKKKCIVGTQAIRQHQPQEDVDTIKSMISKYGDNGVTSIMIVVSILKLIV